MKFVKFSIRFLIVVFLLTAAFVIVLPEREKDTESNGKLEWYSYAPYDEESYCKIKMRVYIENNTAFGYIELISNKEITTIMAVQMISNQGAFSSKTEVNIDASMYGTNKVYRVYFDPYSDVGAGIKEIEGREYYIFMNTDAYNHINIILKDDYRVGN